MGNFQQGKKLAFKELHLENAARMEPAFSPDIFEYDVYPIAGPSTMSFSIVMNIPPAPNDETAPFPIPYPGFKLRYTVRNPRNLDPWVPSSKSNPTENKYTFIADKQATIDVVIHCYADSGDDDSFQLTLHIKPRPLAEGECGHFNTYTQEGEWWGGASGSCQVEIFTFCSDCKEKIGETCEYRD